MRIVKFIREFVPIAVALLAALFTHICPINLGFIPSDKVYGISLTVYSAIITIIFNGLFNLGSLIVNRKSFVKVNFSDNHYNFEQLKPVDFMFDPDIDMTTLYFKVLLEGSPKKFIDKRIEIILPVQVEAHSMDNKYSENCCISEDKKTITVDMKKLFNENKKKRIEDSQVLGFKVLKNYPEVESGLEVSITNNKKKKVKLIHNTCVFRK